jgi:hypothetical protein
MLVIAVIKDTFSMKDVEKIKYMTTNFLAITVVKRDSESVCTSPHDWQSVTVFIGVFYRLILVLIESSLIPTISGTCQTLGFS